MKHRPDRSFVATCIAGACVLASAPAGQEVIQTFSDYSGSAIALSNDIDGDGQWDLVVGDAFYDTAPFTNEGRVRLVSGLTGQPTFEAVGAVVSELLGYQVLAPGDLDQDGTPDFAAIGLGFQGRLVVWSGASGLELFSAIGGSTALEELGDLNGDAIPDFAVGRAFAFGGGEVVIYHGGSFASPYKIEEPNPAWSYFGSSVTGLGDVNGDGVPDLAIGAPGNWSAKFDCTYGHVGVFSGSDGSLLWEQQGEAPQSQFGVSLVSPGDLNADGIADLVVGAPGCCDSSCSMAPWGRVYFYDGASGQLLDQLDSPGVAKDFGIFLAAMPDANGNGVADVFVADGQQVAEMELFLFDGLTREVIYSVKNSYPAATSFGVTLGVEDLDGDDFPDFFLMAPSFTAVPGTNIIDLYSGAPIGVHSYGTACPTADGSLPRIGVTAPPTIGADYQIHLSRVAPGLPAFLALGFSATTWQGLVLPFDLTPSGLAGCSLSVAPNLMFQTTTVPVGPGLGAATVQVPVPIALIGVPTFAQWLVLNPPGSPTLGATTRGLKIDFGVGAPPPGVQFYGCGINPAGSLVVLSGAPQLGGTLTFGVDNPLGSQSAGSAPFLAFSTAAVTGLGSCGVFLAGFGMSGPGFGELLIDLNAPNPYLVLAGPAWAGPGVAAAIALAVPPDPVLLGVPTYAQGILVDGSATSVVPFGLTSAVQLVFSP